MGQSTDGQICYGVLFEEEHEFPWGHTVDADIDDWWLSLSEDAPFYPYTAEGEYKDGVIEGDPCIETYHKTRPEWLKANPVPVELVNVQHRDYPVYILAVPGTVTKAHRGCPSQLQFDRGPFVVSPRKLKAFREFLKAHDIDEGNEPVWWLSSYWG